jgi:uncharacterized protein (DUF1800 family)
MPNLEPPAGLLAPLDFTSDRTWTAREAAHLLGRSQFGYTSAELDLAIQSGPAETIERLLNAQPEPVEFQQAELALRKTALATGEINDLKIWWLYRMWASANPLLEKMSLLWHNHFATSFDKVRSVAQMLNQNELIREHALGHFQQLLHGMSRDTAMLVWLDGNANRKRHPNENFAREIMELFALGVGNYTEKDIQEAARAFSGWHVREGVFWFNQSQHDETEKTVFGKVGNFDGAAIVDLCLSQPACPRFLAMKLLKTFVCSEPKQELIEAVATRIRLHDFVMLPVLRELFSSQVFYDGANRRSLIKSPLDLVVGSLRALAATVKWPSITKLLANLGQDVFEPPSVKGWEGGRLWINSSSILLRTNFATELASTEQLASLRGSVTDVASETSDSIVAGLGRLLMGDLVEGELHASLVALHQLAEGNSLQKLRATIQLILSLPEYQLY